MSTPEEAPAPLSAEDTDPIDLLAEEVAARLRAGERPTADEYAARHPELAEQIHELFPALMLMEHLAPASLSHTLPPAGDGGPPVTPPAFLGEYRLLREVGRGGMGVVYEAVQEPLGRRVALKVLAHGATRSPRYRERFLREARAAARLHHTNIVPVFASGEHDGTLFYAMQFIDGASLAAPASPGAVLPGDRAHAAARLGLQAAEALAHAHAQGVLHRDVKPSNLLVDVRGTLWVADFGLAKTQGEGDVTASGELVGTLRYLAPERFAGRCDDRGDVYALGATLYELLAGAPAFDGEDPPQLMRQITAGAAPPLRRRAPWVPPDLETVVRKAMAADPAERYATAQGLADDLRRFLDDRPVRARRTPAGERLRRWARRNPAVAVLAAAVALLLVLVAVGATVSAVRLDAALGESQGHLRDARAAQEEVAELLWRSQLQQARANRRSGLMGQRVESLRLLEEAARRRVTPELRDEVIACLTMVDLEEVGRERCAGGQEADVLGVDAPRGRYVRLSRPGEVSLHRLRDGRELARLPGAAGMDAFFSLPEGRLVLMRTAGRRGLEVWDPGGPTPRLVLRHDFPAPISAWDVRDDGRVAVCLSDGSTHLLGPGGPTRTLQAGPGDNDLAWHPRRPWLALTLGKSARVIDVRTGREVARLDCPWADSTVHWDHEGRLLASAHAHRVWLYDVESRRVVRAFDERSAAGVKLLSHPSLPFFLSSGWGGSAVLWDVASGRLAVSPPPRVALVLEWGSGPDPLLYAWTRGELVRYRLVPRRVLRVFACHTATGPQSTGQVVMDPRGALATCTHAGLALFDSRSLSGIPSALAEGQLHYPIAFDPSGGLLSNSKTDLVYWPRRDGPGGVPHLGPPETLLRFVGGEGGSSSADGRVVAVGQFNRGAVVLHRDRSGPPLWLSHHDVRRTAVSPDGRWVATGSWTTSPGVKVWEAATGRLVKELPFRDCRQVAFSPDGRWLGTSDGPHFRPYRTDTWAEGLVLPSGSFAFGPDGLLALSGEEGLRLADAATGTVYARLEAAHAPGAVPCCFSADGSLLAAAEATSDTILVWDLRALRQELAARGLDWDRRAYPASPDPGATPALELQVSPHQP
jgi:WD40 repeat protein